MAFAVFFGFVFFGLIYLYVKTRDTWNWKKIVLWFAGIFTVLATAFAIMIFADSFKSIVPETFSKITSYDEITLGDKFNDVEFKKGKLKKIGNIKDSSDDYYVVNNKTALYVDKKTRLVTGLIVGCADYQSIKFNGVGCGDTSDFIQSKFKGEITILCEPEEQRDENAPLRVYDVPKYGVRYMLQMNKVVRMTAFTNEFWTENKTKWVACK
jgi:hypothetical protein